MRLWRMHLRRMPRPPKSLPLKHLPQKPRPLKSLPRKHLPRKPRLLKRLPLKHLPRKPRLLKSRPRRKSSQLRQTAHSLQPNAEQIATHAPTSSNRECSSKIRHSGASRNLPDVNGIPACAGMTDLTLDNHQCAD